jgi:hypothetical protein
MKKINIIGVGVKKNKKAFSLLESILSVFLVSMGLVVSIKLLTLGVSQSMKNRDQFTASLLAQEGVELVRNIRDNNWVDNDPTTGSFYDSARAPSAGILCLGQPSNDSAGGGRSAYYIDYRGYYSCGPNLNNGHFKLCLDSASGFYQNNDTSATATSSCPSGTTDTKYTRRIYNYSPGNGSRIVTSVVRWNGSFGSGSNLSDPANQSTLNACNTANSCAYTQITLNKWGE